VKLRRKTLKKGETPGLSIPGGKEKAVLLKIARQVIQKNTVTSPLKREMSNKKKQSKSKDKQPAKSGHGNQTTIKTRTQQESKHSP